MKQEVQIDSTTHYVGEHILKAINNNLYIRTMLRSVIDFLQIAIDVVTSESPSANFKQLFELSDSRQKMDHDDIANFHSFLKMILLDRKVIVAKAVVLKYAINALLSGNRSKDEYKKLYSLQMYVTLFSIFENKKGIEPVAKILKSRSWDAEIRSAIKAYCSKTTIMERKRGAEFKFSTNPDNEEQRYHSIMLAAVYNYFSFSHGRVSVKKGRTADLHKFLSSPDLFSVEHFIANKSGKCEVSYEGTDGSYQYEYPPEIKKYSSSIFNYIYIPKGLNANLQNRVIQEKLALISKETIECEYSRMVIEAARLAFEPLPVLSAEKDHENKTLIDKYYSYDFKQQYGKFVSIILNNISDRFCVE